MAIAPEAEDEGELALVNAAATGHETRAEDGAAVAREVEAAAPAAGMTAR
jgi:hypothetical protein